MSYLSTNSAWKVLKQCVQRGAKMLRAGEFSCVCEPYEAKGADEAKGGVLRERERERLGAGGGGGKERERDGRRKRDKERGGGERDMEEMRQASMHTHTMK